MLIFCQSKTAGVVIGNDARFNSSRWARLTAGVFLRLGFNGKRFFFSYLESRSFWQFMLILGFWNYIVLKKKKTMLT